MNLLAIVTNELEAHGFSLLRSAVSSATIAQLRKSCARAFEQESTAVSARSHSGHAVAARNVIELVPEVHDCWRYGQLAETLSVVLGPQCGLVRVLFFDKPPDRTWALPWHKDRSIAVADNRLMSSKLSRPTMKAGVPHVIACDEVLRGMLTLRIHLDDVTDENGPLRVVPGSHTSSQASGVGVEGAVTVYAQAGDVLAMRPLLDHASGPSHPETTRHRRILHLEFAADECLPDGFRWFHFVSA